MTIQTPTPFSFNIFFNNIIITFYSSCSFRFWVGNINSLNYYYLIRLSHSIIFNELFRVYELFVYGCNVKLLVINLWKYLRLEKRYYSPIYNVFISDAHACKELHKRSHRFALQNFQEVMNTEEFLLLPFSEVFTWHYK